MVIAEVNIVPVGTDSASISSFVTALVGINGLEYQLTPAATILQGELEQVLEGIRQMEEANFRQGAKRVVTNVTIDERRDKPLNMEHAVESVLMELH